MTIYRRRTREVLFFLLVFLAVRALFGDALTGFMDGIIIGFTDGV